MRTLAVALVIAVLAVPVAASEQFKDVPTDHWAAKAVDMLAQKGIVKGYLDGTFNGDKPVTRYELATVLVKFIDYMRESLQPLTPPKPVQSAAPAKESAKPADPVKFLRDGGFLTEDSVLLQKDTAKPITADQLAQALATVSAKLIEERVPGREETEPKRPALPSQEKDRD